MSKTMWRSGFAVALVAGATLVSGCDSILGAECADGFELCDGRCVPLGTCESDFDGGPDGSIDAGDSGTELDAGDAALDATTDDGSMGDGSMDDAGRGDASVPPGCDLGEFLCGDLCADGRSDPMHCGGCGIECAPGEVCSSGVCAPTCVPPLVLCDALCIDVSSDPDNCGACGVVCASGICIDGECSDALASHVVALGHDYEVRRPGMNRLAGNALFLARGSPVRALMYEGGSTMPTRVGTDAAIQQVATAIGRTWTRIAVSDPSKVTLELADADAFVIYAQTTATDAELRDLGVLWARALQSFIRRGGVIVMFETMAAGHAGTWQILDAAELFDCSGRTEITGAAITVIDPADSVALRVPLAYMGERTTVRFDTAETNVVCSDGTGPVVVHRTIVP